MRILGWKLGGVVSVKGAGLKEGVGSQRPRPLCSAWGSFWGQKRGFWDLKGKGGFESGHAHLPMAAFLGENQRIWGI